jgi:protoheme IX farnesyltransferase
MLPSVATLRATSVQIVLYTVVLWAVTLAFAAVASMGAIYLASALALGAAFAVLAVRLLLDPTPARAMRLFAWSISYISLLFGAMALDQLVRSGT